MISFSCSSHFLIFLCFVPFGSFSIFDLYAVLFAFGCKAYYMHVPGAFVRWCQSVRLGPVSEVCSLAVPRTVLVS